MTGPIAVCGWSAVSGLGVGATAFRDGLLPALPTAAPDGHVPGFAIREALGRKNTRTMDRITALAVLTVATLLDDEQQARFETDPDTTGLVLGTTTGSVQSMMDFTRDSFTQDRPYLVDPARFPNAVMNRAAAQTAIWHGLRGPNATIASGQVAGLSALRYAARLLHAGHATSVLCGAVEELTPLRTWLEDKRQEGGGPAVLGEGCAVLRLGSAEADRPVLAHLLATAFRVYARVEEVPGVLADCASSVLHATGASADEVWAVAADLTDDADTGLTKVLGDRPRRIELAAVLGDTGAASAALLVAAVLCRAAADEAAAGRLALVASVDREGLAGVAAFRCPEPVR